MTGIKLPTIVLMLAGVLAPVPHPAWSPTAMNPPARSPATMFGALSDFFVLEVAPAAAALDRSKRNGAGRAAARTTRALPSLVESNPGQAAQRSQ